MSCSQICPSRLTSGVADTGQYKRFWCGVLPKSKGDYAFITHMIEIAKRQSGRVAVIVLHGILFRGVAEDLIRQQLIKENLLDAVVGLPGILAFDRSRKEGGANEDWRDVLFIDGAKEVHTGQASKRDGQGAY